MEAIKICIVEDCQDEALVLSEGLSIFGYDSVIAPTGAEALEICRSGSVQLVLLDVGLPDMDGYEVCRLLKADPQTADLPVIFVTARGSSHDVSRGYALGAADYVAKPYNFPIIIVHVDAALRTRQGQLDLVAGPYMLVDPVYTDQLTGLRNRRFLIERLQEEAEKAHRYRYPVSCLMLELEECCPDPHDRSEFSPDELLVEVAIALRKSSRTFDIIARYDETQFAAVLPHIPLEDAVSYATKIRRKVNEAVASSPFPLLDPNLCVGIVTCSNGKRAPSADELLRTAMRNLLMAKSGAPDHMAACGFSAD